LDTFNYKRRAPRQNIPRTRTGIFVSEACEPVNVHWPTERLWRGRGPGSAGGPIARGRHFSPPGGIKRA